MKNGLICFKNILLAISFLLVFFDMAFAAEKLTKITDNVYAYVDTKNSSKDSSFGANAGIIIGDNGILVVDTLISAKEGKRFIKDIQAISNKPIKYVVNTHYHLDHVFGNSEFEKLGAIIIAHENDKKSMENSAADTLKNIEGYGLTKEDMDGTVVSYPIVTFSERMTIDIGGQNVELIHAQKSHTDGDIIVYLADKKILFSGDILFTNYHPFIGEGNILDWTKKLDDIKLMDVETIIPGHGPISTKKDLDDMKDYILLFDQKAKELASNSDDVQSIVTSIKSMLPNRAEGEWLITPNIQMKYLKQNK